MERILIQNLTGTGSLDSFKPNHPLLKNKKISGGVIPAISEGESTPTMESYICNLTWYYNIIENKSQPINHLFMYFYQDVYNLRMWKGESALEELKEMIIESNKKALLEAQKFEGCDFLVPISEEDLDVAYISICDKIYLRRN